MSRHVSGKFSRYTRTHTHRPTHPQSIGTVENICRNFSVKVRMHSGQNNYWQIRVHIKESEKQRKLKKKKKRNYLLTEKPNKSLCNRAYFGIPLQVAGDTTHL